RRFLNARNTLTTLLDSGIVPVINENDTVSVEELRFGDNDNLSALTTNLMEADLLIMLSDIGGLYDKDPKTFPSARKIALVEDIDSLNMDDMDPSGGKRSFYGTGGIASKVSAAKKAAHFGCAVVIANGMEPDILKRIFEGEDVGTLILPKEDRLTSKKHWIAYSARPKGKVFVDEGAKAALIKKGRALLPSGIVRVEGDFEAGEVVGCIGPGGTEFARGVVNYSSDEAGKIKGLKTNDIEKTLGYKVYDEVIHRDNLVVL
ncbi:MAG: glutamate 5-kinase, partial [Deltaproteobacteria bacterium]|nr:glutamate 5-kinase [Deltaproteobacteria bacterium]